MTPTIGRIVHYTLSEQDADAINKRRSDASLNLRSIRESAQGYIAHFGNSVAAGDVFPLIITRTWGDTPESHVNGQVMLDGNDTLWACSVKEGEGPRTYAWPARV